MPFLLDALVLCEYSLSLLLLSSFFSLSISNGFNIFSNDFDLPRRGEVCGDLFFILLPPP